MPDTSSLKSFGKTLSEVGILAVVVAISRSKADFEWQSLYAISANRQLAAGRDRCRTRVGCTVHRVAV